MITVSMRYGSRGEKSEKQSSWNGTLYDYGDEYASVTGGWSAYTGTLEKTTEALKFGPVGNVAAQTAKPVDVTKFKTLTIEVYAPTANLCACGLSATKQPPYALIDPDMPYRAEYNRQTEKTTLTVDISAASGLMYPTYMSYGGESFMYKAALS